MSLAESFDFQLSDNLPVFTFPFVWSIRKSKCVKHFFEEYTSKFGIFLNDYNTLNKFENHSQKFIDLAILNIIWFKPIVKLDHVVFV